MLERKLNELNIFALRDLARKTGVKTPTSKKKEQLIKEILEITSGLKSPENKTKQGRPPKVFDYNSSSDFIFESSLSSIQKLNQDVEQFETTDIVTVAGWLELVNNDAGILWVQKDFKNENYFVSSAVLKNLPAKMGDRVVVEVVLDESQKIVKKIFSINDCPIMKLSKQRKDYDQISNIIPNKKLELSNEFDYLNINLGENVYLYGTNNNQNTQSVIGLINNAKIENKFYINVSVAGKNQIFLKEIKNSENFLSNITDESDVAKRLVMLAIERSKRAIEMGEDVLIIVDDMVSILGIEKVGLSLMKNLVSIAKATKNKGSITLIAVMPNKDLIQIEKLADKRFEIMGEKFIEIK